MASTRSVINRPDLAQLIEAHQYLKSYSWMKLALHYYGTTRINGEKNNPEVVRFIMSGLGCSVEAYRFQKPTIVQLATKAFTEPNQVYNSLFGLALPTNYNLNRQCNKSEKEILKDETAWCSAFVNHIMKNIGYEGTIGNKRLSARSWLSWGKEVPIEQPTFGDIIVTKRPGRADAGHVGFYVKTTKNHYQILGGNQSTKSWVCVRNYPKKWILGFRQPN